MDRILIILKKENGLRASSAPALGLDSILFKHAYYTPRQNEVLRGVYCFHVVRPCVRPCFRVSVRASVRNVLFL